MIIGIGTDITAIARIAKTLEEQGQRFIDRCFDPMEQQKVETAASGDNMQRAAGYAKRWAAKEACAKALGLGIRDDIFLKDIIVANDRMGKPSLMLMAGAKDRLAQLTPNGMKAMVHVSLSDDAGVATAFVVIAVEKETMENE